ncbi:MAG: hypothetical protein Q9211_003671 [Gyalolechia sp. 1 TL-2023]
MDEVEKTPVRLPGKLLVLSIFGLATQIIASLLPGQDLAPLPRALTWAVTVLLIAVDRPKTAPVGILAVMCGLLSSQLILFFHEAHSQSLATVLSGCELFLASFSISSILCMPLRDPSLQSYGIGSAFEKPHHSLRSPEDNLTLWQFMTVSWMTPMISVGSQRQLNDEDVWQLSFEFQHQLLHQKFRELGGSVVRRLLQANGLDLIILLSLGTIEALSSKSCSRSGRPDWPVDDLLSDFAGPVLLQQLLRAMENESAPRSKAVIFAVLSLLVRLLACQSSVFSLWYSRRSYERSRGALITMLYEKTLSRKIIGDTVVSETSVPVEGDNNGVGIEDDTCPTRRGALQKLTGPFKKFGRFVEKRIWKSSAQLEVKQAASIGKIYNLMR